MVDYIHTSQPTHQNGNEEDDQQIELIFQPLFIQTVLDFSRIMLHNLELDILYLIFSTLNQILSMGIYKFPLGTYVYLNMNTDPVLSLYRNDNSLHDF